MITLLPPRNQTPFKAIKLLLTGQLFSRVMARSTSLTTARLDGASFDIDVAAVDVQEARAAISAAIVAVMGDRAFRDRLIVATRRAASAN